MHTSHRGNRTRQDLAAEATAGSAEDTSTPVQGPPQSSLRPKRRRIQKRLPIADGDDAPLQSSLPPGGAAQRRSLKPIPTANTDLPDQVISMVYNILETSAFSKSSPATICGSRALRLQPLPREYLGAHALALASPVFASVFRRECIRGVVVRGACDAGFVGEAVERYERVQSLTVEKPKVGGSAALRLHNVLGGRIVEKMKRLILTRVDVERGDICEIARGFPLLQELVLKVCILERDTLELILMQLGPRLRMFSLNGMLLPSVDLDDVGAVQLKPLSKMEDMRLNLSGFNATTIFSFAQLAGLTTLRKLNLDETSFCDEDVMSLSQMTNLHNLSVEFCSQLTQKIIAFLPPSLKTLNKSHTSVLSLHTPEKVFSASPPVISGFLVALQANSIPLADWRPQIGIPSLRQAVMHDCTLTASHAKEAWDIWKEVKLIDISGCRRFGNGWTLHLDVHHALTVEAENAAGDIAIDAVVHAARHVKKIDLTDTGVSCYQWIAIARRGAKISADDRRPRGAQAATIMPSYSF